MGQTASPQRIPFLLSLGAIYVIGLRFAYEHANSLAHQVLLGGLYFILPTGLLAFAVFMIANGIAVRRRERKSLANSLSLFFGAGIIAYAALLVTFIWKSQELPHLSDFWWRVSTMTFIFITFLFAILMFVFFAFLTYSILYATLSRKRDYNYIIIHGAGLRDGEHVTPLLASRIDTAIKAFKAGTDPNVKLIASGRQGKDEVISEAEAISRYALDKGIPADRILLENRSATTWQNLRMSKEVATADSGMPDPHFLFVTSNYHVLRTAFYARKIGLKGDGLGAGTAGYYIPTAFLREYVAILVKLRWVIIGMLLVFAALMYLAR